MTIESQRDGPMARAGVALRAIGRTLVRVGVYLGPLLLEAGAYVWRVSLDTVLAARVLSLRYRTRKAPERAEEFQQIAQQHRDTKTARWVTWRATPLRRRLAVQTTAIAVLVTVAAIARAYYQTSAPLEIDGAPAGVIAGTVVTATVPTTMVDLDAAATRFQAGVRAMAPGQWTFLTEGPVLAPGARAEWDGFTIAFPWVMREVERGATRYRMWYRGCHFRGRDRGCAIGHATSADGIRWKKTTGPVFEPSDPDERRLLGGVTVVRSGDRYFMWYSIAPEWVGPRKPSALHLATSSDGLRWEAVGQVLTTVERRPYPMEPSALHDGRQFHLWFVDSLRSFEADNYELQTGAPFLMHFTSPDGRAWQKASQFPLQPIGLDRPRVTVEPRRDGGFQATCSFAGQYVRLVSRDGNDGNDWSADQEATTTIEGRSLSELVWYLRDATGLESDGGTLVWFVTKRQRGHEEIRVGFRKAK